MHGLLRYLVLSFVVAGVAGGETGLQELEITRVGAREFLARSAGGAAPRIRYRVALEKEEKVFRIVEALILVGRTKVAIPPKKLARLWSTDGHFLIDVINYQGKGQPFSIVFTGGDGGEAVTVTVEVGWSLEDGVVSDEGG